MKKEPAPLMFPSDECSHGYVISQAGFNHCPKGNVIGTLKNFTGYSDTVAQKNYSLVFAGQDSVICLDMPYFTVSGNATNYWYVVWMTGGDGFFSDANQLTTNYFPGANDKSTGLVRLILTIFTLPPELLIISDTVNYQLVLNPEVYGGEQVTICQSDVVELSGQARYCSSHYWITLGDGYFENPYQLNTVYHPGQGDLESGECLIKLCAEPISPCVDVEESPVMIKIRKIPQVSYLEDITICRGNHAELQASVQNYSSITWTTSGDGTFSDPSALITIYTPGPEDISNQLTTVTLLVSPIEPCNQVTEKSVNIHITPYPIAQIFTNQSICEGNTIVLEGYAANYSSFIWMSLGNGVFEDPTSIYTRYFPGSMDLERNFALIMLLVNSLSPCNFSTGAYVEIPIVPEPLLEIDYETPDCDKVQFYSIVQNADSIVWISTGDGYFNDSTISDPVYYVGENDLSTGSVMCYLIAYPESPCSVSAVKEIIINLERPEITLPLISQQVIQSQTVSLIFQVNSQFQGFYRWLFNGNLLSITDSPVFEIENVQSFNGGLYQCIFEYNCGAISSDEVLLTVLEPDTVSYFIPDGWSAFSLPILPSTAQFPEIFASLMDQLVIVTNHQGIYWPSMGINTLGEWNNQSGYLIKLIGAGNVVTISGYIPHPSIPYVIPPGWSVIPVKHDQWLDVVDLFGDYPQIMIVRDIFGTGIYWPAMQINSLGSLIPGKAYYVFNSSSFPVIVTVPE